MPKASVKRLIECNKEQLIDLVLDIEIRNTVLLKF